MLWLSQFFVSLKIADMLQQSVLVNSRGLQLSTAE
jgi:hypothetical protein